ncbi:MAG: AmmeMemoRadiSam system protein A [Chloroflexota bacterium]|nr:AmmeMemoRadiSam system protein A [Chloroflexota bacterium]
MSADYLTSEERDSLLNLARQALEAGVRGNPLPELNPDKLTQRLRADGAAFITLTKSGQLRGCIGTLEARRPLAEDVREHAIAAALNDFRFPTVRPTELPDIDIEISCLTAPKPLDYADQQDLLARLRPGVDGVVLRDGMRRATFLPQVWEKLPNPVEFLNHLSQKMGASPDLWRTKDVDVLIYQVEKFHE